MLPDIANDVSDKRGLKVKANGGEAFATLIVDVPRNAAITLLKQSGVTTAGTCVFAHEVEDGVPTLIKNYKMIVMKTDDLSAVQAKALSLWTSCLGIARLPRGQYALKVDEASYVSVMAKMTTMTHRH